MKQKLNAEYLRHQKPASKQLKELKRQLIYLIIDDVLDTYNIGAIFRLADAVAASRVIICGRSETPPNIKIHRAAIGTDKWVPWQYCASTSEAIKKLRKEVAGLRVFAIEQSSQSVDYRQINYSLPIALVVGNETSGVSNEVLSLVDQVLEIPMWGFNVSLNVMISLAIVLWKAMEKN